MTDEPMEGHGAETKRRPLRGDWRLDLLVSALTIPGVIVLACAPPLLAASFDRIWFHSRALHLQMEITSSAGALGVLTVTCAIVIQLARSSRASLVPKCLLFLALLGQAACAQACMTGKLGSFRLIAL